MIMYYFIKICKNDRKECHIRREYNKYKSYTIHILNKSRSDFFKRKNHPISMIYVPAKNILEFKDDSRSDIVMYKTKEAILSYFNKRVDTR
jgi:hypothetical protein